MFTQKKTQSNIKGYVGGIIALVFVTIAGFFGYEEFSSRTPVTVATASKLEMDMANALSDKSLADHEDLYKVFKGVSEYAKNAPNIDKTVDVYKAIAEVNIVYNIEHRFSKVSPILSEKLNTVLTGDSKFVDKKQDIIREFDELADAVKYSAEHLKGK